MIYDCILHYEPLLPFLQSHAKMMDSTLPLTTAMALLSLSKTLNSSSNSSSLISRFHRPTQLLRHPLSRSILVSASCRGLYRFGPTYLPRSLVALQPVRCRLACVSNSAASFASGGGGFRGNGGGGGGGGGGGREDGRTSPRAVAGGADDASVLSSDVIILDVGGMTCGGCAASVKRILETQPQVSSANVNLTTETAIIWPVTEAKVVPNWQTQLGEALAKHLTNCGFKSKLRGQGAIEGDVPL